METYIYLVIVERLIKGPNTPNGIYSYPVILRSYADLPSAVRYKEDWLESNEGFKGLIRVFKCIEADKE